MATLIRITSDNTTVSGTTYPADTVLNVDDERARQLIAEGVAITLETVSEDLDDVAASTAKFGCLVALAGAATTLDLTSLGAAGASRAGGVTNFSAVHTLVLHNFGTGTMVLTVGAAAANPFTANFLGGTGPTVKVPAGGKIVFRNPAAAGWATSSANNLKLDPGADTFKVGVAIGGVAT